MALDNVRSILKIGSPISSYKLLLMQGALSRPRYRAIFLALLQPFVKHGQIELRYRCYNRVVKSLIRISDMESDFFTTRELAVNDVYGLDFAFHPGLVIDGGGNIGMFTLRAAAGLEAEGHLPVRFAVYEPVPQSLEQVRKHLTLNGVQAEVVGACLGGTPGRIPFYCRNAIASSFDSTKPYATVIEIPVVTLQDAIGPAPAERILIKLDIEGMEVEALSSFIPSEHRAIYLVGELHGASRNAPVMQELFRSYGWTLQLYEIANDACTFRGCSPAALPLLPSITGVAQR